MPLWDQAGLTRKCSSAVFSPLCVAVTAAALPDGAEATSGSLVLGTVSTQNQPYVDRKWSQQVYTCVHTW
jgi:hypothetical protein